MSKLWLPAVLAVWFMVLIAGIFFEREVGLAGFSTGVCWGIFILSVFNLVLNEALSFDKLKFTYNDLPAWNPLRWIGYLRLRRLRRISLRNAVSDLRRMRHLRTFTHQTQCNGDTNSWDVYVHLYYSFSGEREIRLGAGSNTSQKDLRGMLERSKFYHEHYIHFENGEGTIEEWRNKKI